jgi:pimeloyl-ACP methyl ester carboxylesterase
MLGQFDGGKWGYAEEYLRLFKNHQLVIIPKAGHSIALEQPTHYIHNILSFLNK